jgi:hypothetical protein
VSDWYEALLNGLLEQAAAQNDDEEEDPEDTPRTVGLLAVACLETAELVPPELRAAIIAQARSYIPPQSYEEAAQLAKAGDPIVPLLAHQPAHDPDEAARCVLALAQIGTSTAMEMLVGYTACEYENEYEEDEKNEVTGALGTAWEHFDRQAYTQAVLVRLDKLRSYPYNLQPILITCWQDIAALTHMKELHIKLPDDITDLTPLAGIISLQRLWLSTTAVSDLTPLAGIISLQRLDLQNTAVSDLTPLAGIISLQRLWLQNTAVSDLTPLAGLTNLQRLWLQNTAVSDLTPLAGLTGLKELSLSSSSLSDLTPLAGLTNLQTLWLKNTAVSDLTPLAGIISLQRLWLQNTAVSDLTPLAGLTNLRELRLSGTEADTTPLKHLEELVIFR